MQVAEAKVYCAAANVASALRACEERGIGHRDVKPENLLVEPRQLHRPVRIKRSAPAAEALPQAMQHGIHNLVNAAARSTGNSVARAAPRLVEAASDAPAQQSEMVGVAKIILADFGEAVLNLSLKEAKKHAKNCKGLLAHRGFKRQGSPLYAVRAHPRSTELHLAMFKWQPCYGRRMILHACSAACECITSKCALPACTVSIFMSFIGGFLAGSRSGAGRQLAAGRSLVAWAHAVVHVGESLTNVRNIAIRCRQCCAAVNTAVSADWML